MKDVSLGPARHDPPKQETSDGSRQDYGSYSDRKDFRKKEPKGSRKPKRNGQEKKKKSKKSDKDGHKEKRRKKDADTSRKHHGRHGRGKGSVKSMDLGGDGCRREDSEKMRDTSRRHETKKRRRGEEVHDGDAIVARSPSGGCDSGEGSTPKSTGKKRCRGEAGVGSKSSPEVGRYSDPAKGGKGCAKETLGTSGQGSGKSGVSTAATGLDPLEEEKRAARARFMAPMRPEEYQAQQNVVREVSCGGREFNYRHSFRGALQHCDAFFRCILKYCNALQSVASFENLESWHSEALRSVYRSSVSKPLVVRQVSAPQAPGLMPGAWHKSATLFCCTLPYCSCLPR
ncbi:unnamed protein product [Discosporangium mesarthrocarpum]